VKVADLFGALGIRLDAASFAAADRALARVKANAEALNLREAISATVGDTARAMELIGVNADHALAGQEQRFQARAKRIRAGFKSAFRFAGGAALVGFGVLQAVKGISRLSDSYNSAASRVRSLTDDTQKQKEINDALFKSAQNTGSAFGDVARLYQQVGKAAIDNGRSLEQGVAIVDTISKALKASGATGEGASAALQQLSQGLGSGTLRGEEFNSVLEQAPSLIDILAKDLGKTRGEMRKLADAGKLTSKVILGALERQAPAIEEAFGKRIPLISEQFARMRNQIEKAFGEMMQDKETAKSFGVAMDAVAKGVIGIVKAFAATVVFFANHKRLFVVTLVAITAALSVLAAQAAITWLAIAGPIALVIAALAAFVLYWEDIVAAMFAGWMKLGDGIEWFIEKIMSIPRAVRRAASAVGRFFSAVGDAVRGAFENVMTWIVDKVNWVVDKINWAIHQLNRLPGVDIDTLGQVGGSPAAAARTFTPIQRSSGAAPVVTGPVSTVINVNSPNADPVAVANETRKQFDAFLGERLRTASDAIG
jgi:tape measure domain-containing protein